MGKEFCSFSDLYNDYFAVIDKEDYKLEPVNLSIKPFDLNSLRKDLRYEVGKVLGLADCDELERIVERVCKSYGVSVLSFEDDYLCSEGVYFYGFIVEISYNGSVYMFAEVFRRFISIDAVDRYYHYLHLANLKKIWGSDYISKIKINNHV